MNRAMYVLRAGVVALLFVFSGFSVSAQVRLTAVQYWLDDQAMDQSLTQRNVPGTETWDWQKDLDLTGVTTGLHFLHYRFLDTEGRWSSAYSHLFFKTTRPDNEILSMQYWLDDKQPSGIMPYSPTFDLDLSGVVTGLHFLHIRYLDKQGRWSSAYTHLFYKTNPPNNEIVSMQYWLDEKQPSGIMPYRATFDLDLSGVATGLHFLHIRYLDKQGRWSSAYTHPLNHNPTGQDAFLTASGFHLYPNRPNPFHESTTISYELATSCEIHLTVTDLFGKNIATLHSGFQQAGQHDIEWSNRGLSAGIYFYQLSTPFGRLTRKMVITE